MADVLLDTDVIIDHLRGYRSLDAPEERSAYSTLTRAELYAGRHVVEAALDEFLSRFTEIPVDRVIAEEGGRIKRAHGMALADAIIAATAITTRRALITRNRRHFAEIPGLELRAP